MKKNIIKKIIFIFFVFFKLNYSFAENNNSIIITVGNQPITNLDLIKEIKIIALTSNILITETNQDQIKDLAIKSLIKRSIKETEIQRLNIVRFSEESLKNNIETIANKLGLDQSNFTKLLKQNNLDIDDLKKRFEIDLKWNAAIFKLYKNKIYLNTVEIEEKINLEIKNIKSEKVFLLSEIAINLPSENYGGYIEKIKQEIVSEGFEKTAKDFSISESAKYGGNIGWIKEEQLTRKIYNSVKVLKKGEISDAIIIDGKIIFIKKNDERTNDPNIEIVKEEIVNKEKMKKLDMFSNSHYSELEKKIQVKFL